MWSKPDSNWDEDTLYGINAKGELGHIELDSVTFERGCPQPINLENSPKYIASEMCQVFGSVWGYAKNDLSYVCRKCGSNMLLNVGPMGNGLLRNIDAAYLEIIGRWTKYFGEAIYAPKPCDINIKSPHNDFILRHENSYYLFHYVTI